MSAKQTSHLLGRFVEHQHLFDSLTTTDVQWAIQNPKDAIALCIKAIEDRPEPKLLELVAQTSTHQTKEDFVVGVEFVEGVDGIIWVGENFLLNFSEKVELPFPGGSLNVNKLLHPSCDGPIMDKLGGEAKAETTLTEIKELIKRQARGEEGVLAKGGQANIFFVRDIDDRLRVVAVGEPKGRSRGGWGVDAGSVVSPDQGLNGGDFIFSRLGTRPK